MVFMITAMVYQTMMAEYVLYDSSYGLAEYDGRIWSDADSILK
jgi:hypothetical protein